MYLLDTNVCIALLNGNVGAIAQFNRNFSQCYLSTLVVAELYKGIYCSQQIQQNLNHLAELTMLLPIESFDLGAAAEFGKIQAELRQIARPTGVVDALIAAVARSRQDVLVTNNLRHFENIPHLLLQNWLVAN